MSEAPVPGSNLPTKEMEALVARAAWYNGVVSMCFVLLALFTYATDGLLRGQPWSALRAVVKYGVPVYLFLVVAGVLVGMLAAWGASDRGIRNRGLGGTALCVASTGVLVLGYALMN